METLIKVEHLSCGYSQKAIVNDVSFSVQAGEVACLIGPNGVGKTTLFKTMLGLLNPISGQISYFDKPLHSYASKEFAKKVAYVPQSHVPPFPFSVRDIVVMGRNPHINELSQPSAEDYEKADEALTLMGISHLAAQDYTEVSGGERQLAIIARALTQDTKLLLMDEPTAYLDFGNTSRVHQEVEKLSDMGYTIVMITHQPDHVFRYGDKVFALGRDSKFVEGVPEEVLSEELLTELYNIPIELKTVQLREDNRSIKVCIPLS